MGGWRETGFLRGFSMRGEDMGKNPVSGIVGGWPSLQNFYANNVAIDALKPGNKGLVKLSSLNKVMANCKTPFSRR